MEKITIETDLANKRKAIEERQDQFKDRMKAFEKGKIAIQKGEDCPCCQSVREEDMKRAEEMKKQSEDMEVAQREEQESKNLTRTLQKKSEELEKETETLRESFKEEMEKQNLMTWDPDLLGRSVQMSAD